MMTAHLAAAVACGRRRRADRHARSPRCSHARRGLKGRARFPDPETRFGLRNAVSISYSRLRDPRAGLDERARAGMARDRGAGET